MKNGSSSDSVPLEHRCVCLALSSIPQRIQTVEKNHSMGEKSPMTERCAYCGLVIQWPEEHTVRDRDGGLIYHADCYAQYKTFQCHPMPGDWQIKTLGELFDKRALHRLRDILQKKDLQALDLFVNEHRDELIQKGVLPKYLYYYLSYAFKMEEKP